MRTFSLAIINQSQFDALHIPAKFIHDLFQPIVFIMFACSVFYGGFHGAKFDYRSDRLLSHLGCDRYKPLQTGHQNLRPIRTTRKYGPYLRAVFTGSAYRPLSRRVSRGVRES